MIDEVVASREGSAATAGAINELCARAAGVARPAAVRTGDAWATGATTVSASRTATRTAGRRRDRRTGRAGVARSMTILPVWVVPGRTGHGPQGPVRQNAGTSMAPVVYCRPMLRVYLGHGASGTAASMAPWVDGLRDRGIEAHALELPKRKAEEAVAAYEAQVPDEPGAVIGGHSFGGRVASLAVAGVRVAGAVERAQPVRGPRLPVLPAPCARARPRRPTRGPRTGPRSTSRPCSCRGPPTRSPASTSSRQRCPCCEGGAW